MGDVLRAVRMGRVDEVLGNQRTGKGAHQRVFVLVHGVGHHGGGQVLVREGFAHVDDQAFDGAGLEGLGLDGLETVVLLAEIAHDGDNVKIVLLLQPFDADRGVQTARVGEDDLVFLRGGVGALSHDDAPF